MKYFKYLMMTVLLFGLVACAGTPEQKVLGDIAVRNAVAQYIQAGDDPTQRAADTAKRIDQIEAGLNAAMAPGDIRALLEAKLATDDLSPADRLLMKDVLELTTARLEKPDLPTGEAYKIAQNFIKQARFAVSLYQ